MMDSLEKQQGKTHLKHPEANESRWHKFREKTWVQGMTIDQTNRNCAIHFHPIVSSVSFRALRICRSNLERHVGTSAEVDSHGADRLTRTPQNQKWSDREESPFGRPPLLHVTGFTWMARPQEKLEDSQPNPTPFSNNSTPQLPGSPPPPSPTPTQL